MVNRNKIIFIIIPFLIFSFNVNVMGQTSSEIFPVTIPPSPNAQTFLKFGDIPVSKYTGVPDISVPIYNIQMSDISFPVTLAYNASGIKVEEEAGRTGLGWVLNCGGIITHTLKGRYNDFYDEVYFNNGSNNQLKNLNNIYQFDRYTIGTLRTPFPFSLPNGMTKYEFYKSMGDDDIGCGGIEMAPDEFQYSFMGKSNKFIFDHQGNIIKEFEDNIKIVPYKGVNGKLISWLLIDDVGNRYKFDQTEQTIQSGRGLDRGTYNSAFYLTEIETLKGTKINLYYKKDKSFLGKFNRSEDDRLVNRNFNINYATYEVVYLDRVNFNNISAELKFEYSFDRQDYKPEPKLNRIILNRNSSKLSEWELNYDYFVSNNNRIEKPTLAELLESVNPTISFYDINWNTKRLKLSGIKKLSNNSENSENYLFQYNENNLPTKLSASLDHWGYYNGANNNSLIPRIVENVSFNSSEVKLNYIGRSSDRNPNENYSKAFLINKIKYPTGGMTVFEYEGNKFRTDDFEFDPAKKRLMFDQLNVTLEEGTGYNNVPIEFQHTIDFSIPNSPTIFNLPVNIHLEIILDDSYNNSKGTQYLDVSIEEKGSGIKYWQFIFQAPYTPITVNNSNRTFQKIWNDVSLPTGKTYVIKIFGPLRTHIRNTKATVIRTIRPEEILEQKKFDLGGGLRVKNVISYDAESNQIGKRNYVYTTNGSYNELYTSGRLMYYPRYRKEEYITSSNGIRDNGYVVGYSTVHEFQMDHNNVPNGKIIYSYINKPDLNLDYSWINNDPNVNHNASYGTSSVCENPDGIGRYKFAENGSLLKQQNFKWSSGTFHKLSEIQNEYTYYGGGAMIYWGLIKSSKITENSIVCMEPTTWAFLNHPDQNYSHTFKPSGYLYPAIIPMQKFLSKVIMTDYFGPDSTQHIKNMTYDSDTYLLDGEHEILPNLKSKSVTYKYPKDFSGTIYNQMLQKNLLNIPIEINTIIADKSEQSKYEFSLNVNTPVLKSKFIKTNFQANLEKQFEVIRFDQNSNPLELKVLNGSNIVYLWGYGGQYPIAEIKNATYTDVETVLTKATIDALNSPLVIETMITDAMTKLRIDSRLSKAMISSYTYKPLVGMTSKTDARGVTEYYEYDGMQRLKAVLDQLKNVTTSMDYHYRSN